MAALAQAQLITLVNTYIEANRASDTSRLKGDEAEYEEGYAAGLSDGLDALTESISVASRLIYLSRGNAERNAYNRGYVFALTDIAYIIDNGAIPGGLSA